MEDDYFNEVMPFTDPSELENKFETLETQNLIYVTRLQEIEAELEDMRVNERRSRIERDFEYYKQLEYRNKIEEEIELSRQQLALLRRQGKHVNFSSDTKDSSSYTIDEMLDKLHNSIKRIYCNVLDIPKEADLGQKQSLEMLTAIEARALEYIEEMQSYTLTDNQYLMHLEGEQKKLYQNEKLKLTQEKEREKDDARQAMVKNRSMTTFVKVGRSVMERCPKPEMQKRKKTPERDE